MTEGYKTWKLTWIWSEGEHQDSEIFKNAILGV